MIALVTATVDKPRAEPCLASWTRHARGQTPVVVLKNGSRSRQYLGVVPAFKKAMDLCRARHTAEIIACLHDDLVILDQWWDQRVLQLFAEQPEVGLVGFAGASRLGADAITQGYRSNLVDAEHVGARSLVSEPVACVDGFALIGRKAFWDGLDGPAWQAAGHPTGNATRRGQMGGFHIAPSPWDPAAAPWARLEQLGLVSHCVGEAMSCLAHQGGWQVWIVPVRCRHLGGQTTTDPGYQQWAEMQIAGGDRGFDEAAHRITEYQFKDLLPLAVGGSAAATG